MLSQKNKTACITIASKQGIHINGRQLPHKKLVDYLQGYKFLGNHYDGLINISHLDHREDMTFSFKILFKGLEGKLYKNEYDDAIYHWKMLADQGFMDDGINSTSILKMQEKYENLEQHKQLIVTKGE